MLALLVTKVLLDWTAVADADEWFPEWLNERRTPFRTDLSDIGSRIGDVPVVPALVALTAIVSLAVRQARIGVFLITAIVIELTLYRLAAWVGPRERPDVPRLDDHLPMDESFPSGHVAATTVTYVGLAMIISSWARRRFVSAIVWTIAMLAVLGVALSRMYRGMHHPIDALGGLLLGLGCLAVALIAIRVYGHVRARRERAPTGRREGRGDRARGKTFGEGLPELRAILERRGIHDLQWREVPKSRKAPKQVREALEWGADLIFVWGGDGMAQRSIDALDGADTPIALLPAGTANLLAASLGIPKDVAGAVDVGLRGDRKRIDIGRINGEAFAVMAGAGLDARMIADADGGLKDRLGRLSYVWTGLKNLRAEPFTATVSVEGTTWYNGPANCVIAGNVGKLFAGLELFEDSHEDDGMLELGVLTATGALATMRTMARVAVTTVDDGPTREPPRPARSGCASTGRCSTRSTAATAKVRSLKIRVVPGALVVCVPSAAVSP